VITIPVKLIPDLKRAASSDVESVEVLGRGGGLHWRTLDLNLSHWFDHSTAHQNFKPLPLNGASIELGLAA
jgi:hypothetical protein